MKNLCEKKFLEGSTGIAESEIYNNYTGDLLTLQTSCPDITGVGICTVELLGRADINQEWSPIIMINLATFAATEIIDTQGIFQASINGITQLKIVRLDSTGNTINVFGRITN